jgi:hypothetical protein
MNWHQPPRPPAFGRFGAVGCLATGGIVLGLIGAFVGVVVGIWAAVDPSSLPILGSLADPGVETREVPGDPRAFDPIAALPDVAAFAGDGAQLVSISIGLVRADGTLDLDAEFTPKPDVRYAFVREVSRPDDAPPPGAGGANTGPWYEEIDIHAYDPGARRQVTRIGDGSGSVVRYTNKGMDRSVGEIVSGPIDLAPAPACAIDDMFAVAIERGAPADAVARIEYDSAGYRFSITGIVSIEFGHDCRMVE